MIKFGNDIIKVNNSWLNPGEPTPPGPDPYNPLNLPPYTIRLLYEDGVTPSFNKGTGVQVSSSPNVWDLTYENSDWQYILNSQNNLIEVLGANTTNVSNMIEMFEDCSSLTTISLFDTTKVTRMNEMFNKCTSITTIPLFDTSLVTSMSNMFNGCTSLTTIPLIDTSSVTYMGYMFYHCTSLTSVPLIDTSAVTSMSNMFYHCTSLTTVTLFDTSSVTDMDYMFSSCRKVESGALALYQQASSQVTPPSYHTGTFRNCGRDTTTGAAELAQIPSYWK